MRQESIRAVVVFPAPLGPSRATISPARTSKERFFCGYHLSESSCKPFGSDHLRADFTTTVGKGSGPQMALFKHRQKLVQGQGIDHVLGLGPSTAGREDPISHEPQMVGVMGVGAQGQFHPGIDGLPNVFGA